MAGAHGPVTTTVELCRRTVEQRQDAPPQSMGFRKRLNDAPVDGMTGRVPARRAVEPQCEAIYAALDALETNVPGTEDAAAEVGETVDEQLEQVRDVTEQVRDTQNRTPDS